SRLERCGDDLVQARVQVIVAGNDLLGADRMRAATIIGDEAAGLAHEQAPSGGVPRLEVAFPEPVVTARGDPCEVERGGAEPAYPRHLRPDRRQDPRPFAEIPVRLIGNAGGDQRLAELPPGRNAQPGVLQPGAAALFRPEALVGDRLVDEPGDYLTPAPSPRLGFLDCDRDGEMRDAVEEVAGAVERIDDPARLRRIALDRAPFLEHEAPVRPRRAQLVPQCPFRCLVGLRYEVRRSLAAHLEVGDLSKIAPQAAAGLACGALHHADQPGNCSQLEIPRQSSAMRTDFAETLISPQPVENSNRSPSPATE